MQQANLPTVFMAIAQRSGVPSMYKNMNKNKILGKIALAGTIMAMGTALAPQQADATLPTSVQRAEQAAHAKLPPLEVERTLTLTRGQTVAAALREAGFDPNTLKTLKANNPVATQPVSGKTKLALKYQESSAYAIGEASLTFRPEPTQEVTLALTANGQTVAKVAKKPLTEHHAVAVGRIQNSLYADAEAAGLSPQQIKQFMDIFAWDLDYTRDIHPGDTFQVMYEETRNDLGQRVKTGKILAATFTVGNETRQAYLWQGEKGQSAEYLNEKGESKRKLLLRTPIEVYRISSGFGMRTHPVLGYSKMHRGTDFAAPIGTPVKASGDGIITYLGPKGPSGNLIIIQHNQKFSTAYAHLHRFSKGLKVGSRVRQGQIIAQVGTTGRSTGPHLHYEVRVNGEQVNPMRADLPTSNPLSRSQLASFKAMVNKAQLAWRQARGTELAQR
jgi:murein DD-endopeptidase MepM/ murein hydrolase activator NlpD